MKITRITATPLLVPSDIEFGGTKRSHPLPICFAEVETDTGVIGYGMTAITDSRVPSAIINELLKPALVGLDPMRHEQVWEKMYWLLAPRGQTGYAGHAMAAVDTALWDIKGKVLGEPVWRLLGGARERVEVYTTFGFPAFDREQLAELARQWTQRGSKRLKMVVGHQALQRRDTGASLAEVVREDARRVRAVRDAIGDDVQLYIDANCSLDLVHAVQLARAVQDCGITFFEEPVTQNDIGQLAEFRRLTGMQTAAGQNEGLMFRFRDMITANAVDWLQPNVVIGGGFTQCLKIAALAAAHNMPIVNGGGWPFHNMHLQAGAANGSMIEYHHFAVIASQAIYQGLPEPEDGWLTLPTAPGLGFSPDLDAIRSIAAASF